MSEDPCFLSAVDVRAHIVRKQVSSVEHTGAVSARHERLQSELRCFITLCDEQAMLQAQAAELKLAAGEPLGHLHGIPFPAKDIVNTTGVRTTFGALPDRNNVPAQDAVAAARLRAQGGILIGGTRTAQWRVSAVGAELEELAGSRFVVEPISNDTVWRARFEKLAAHHKDALNETFLKQLKLSANVRGVEFQSACLIARGAVPPRAIAA